MPSTASAVATVSVASVLAGTRTSGGPVVISTLIVSRHYPQNLHHQGHDRSSDTRPASRRALCVFTLELQRTRPP
ncbi:hypothetical protein GCM10027597_10400 [Saccharopolyspora tripterygii]